MREEGRLTPYEVARSDVDRGRRLRSRLRRSRSVVASSDSFRRDVLGRFALKETVERERFFGGITK
jgi:hypothetical protein